MLDKLQSSDFLPYMNQVFQIHLDNLPALALQLVSTTELGAPSAGGIRGPFSLHFLGPVSSQYLPQRTYHMEHEKMGGLDLFIVPLGFEAGRMRYEAIFT